MMSQHDSAERHRIVDVHKVCFKDKLLKLFRRISGATEHKINGSGHLRFLSHFRTAMFREIHTVRHYVTRLCALWEL